MIDEARPEAGRDGSTLGIVNAITVDELELMLDILALETADRNVARSLHADYLDAWSDEIAPILESAAARTPYENDDAFGREALLRNGEHLDAVEAARRLDDRFLDDVATAIGASLTPDRRQAVRLQRIFDRSVDAAPPASTGRFVTVAPEVSPFEIIDRLDFDPATRADAIAALLSEAPGLLDAYSGVDTDRIAVARREILDSMAYRANELSYLEFTRASNRRALEVLGKLERRKSEVETALLDVVVPSLDPIAAFELGFEICDQSMASRGDARTTRAVKDALRLPGLGADRVELLATILREHLALELELVARARALRTDPSRMPEVAEIEGGVSTRHDGEQAIAQELGKLAFRRDELRERLRKRVLATLSSAERERIEARR